MMRCEVDETQRTFATCIGEVNNRYLSHEPRVVGATYLAPTDEYDFGVQFLVPAEADVARGDEQGLVSRLKRSMGAAMARHSLQYATSRLYVTLSSLEAEGIKR